MKRDLFAVVERSDFSIVAIFLTWEAANGYLSERPDRDLNILSPRMTAKALKWEVNR